MSNVKINEYEVADTIADAHISEIYQGDSSGIRREKKVTEGTKKTYYQGDLPSRADDVDTRIDGVDTRIDGVDTSITGIGTRIDGVDTRIDGVDTDIVDIGTRIDGVDTRIDGVDTSITGIGTRIDGVDTNILAIEDVVNPTDKSISLATGRTSFAELTTRPTVTVDGWYKVFYVPDGATAFKAREADFRCSYLQSVLNFSAGYVDGGATTYEQHIELKPSTGITTLSSAVYGARLGYDPTSTGKGAIIEVYVNTDVDGDLGTQILGNFDSEQAGTGWLKYDTPAISDGFLPDGVTVPTFIEAGASYDLSLDASFLDAEFVVSDVDTLIGTIHWPEKVKAGTNLTITDPSTDWVVYGNGVVVNTTAFVVSGFALSGNNINITLTKTGAFSGITASHPVSLRTNGTGAKLEIV